MQDVSTCQCSLFSQHAYKCAGSIADLVEGTRCSERVADLVAHTVQYVALPRPGLACTLITDTRMYTLDFFSLLLSRFRLPPSFA